MSILVDNREGSDRLANYEPIRSLLPPCPRCEGLGNYPGDRFPSLPAHHQGGACLPCRGTGRRLSRITTSSGAGGPDVLMVGNGPSGPLLVAVEVKEVRDLLQSADTGRLQAQGEGQLQAMLADYDQSWLLWYGQIRCGDDGYLEEPSGRGDNGRCLWRPFSKNGSRAGREDGRSRLPCSYLDGLLIAVARMGVHVHRVHNEREAARWLGVLYESWTKSWDAHTFERTFNAAPRFPLRIDGVTDKELARARRVFDRYPGLGMERALAAAKHFGSVREMANADEKDWRKVPGIGKVIAAAVVKGFVD